MGNRIMERLTKEAENKKLRKQRRNLDKLRIGTEKKLSVGLKQEFKVLEAERNELLRRKEMVEEALHDKRSALDNAGGVSLSRTTERIKRLEEMLDGIDARLVSGIPAEKAIITERIKELEQVYHR